MARLSSIPQSLSALACQLGYERQRLRIPANDSRLHAAVRDLCQRADDQMIACRTCDEKAVRKIWWSVRREALTAELSVVQMHRAMVRAQEALRAWWRDGEVGRVRKARRFSDGVQEYRRVRDVILAGRVPKGPAELVALGVASVGAAWWHHDEGQVLLSWKAVEDLVFLAVVHLDGNVDTAELARVHGARQGWSPDMVTRLTERMEAGLKRAVESLEPWKQTA